MKPILLSIFVIILLSSCGSKDNKGSFLDKMQGGEQTGQNQQDQIIDEDYNTFYYNFFADSVFQISRISWPLDGGIYEGEYQEIWTSQNWGFIDTPISALEDDEFKFERHENEDVVTEKIYVPYSGSGAEFQFKKINGKWHLIFCEMYVM